MGVRHEDARKHDSLAAILAAKEQGIGAILRLQWRTFAADIMAVRLQKNSNRRNDVRHYRQFIRDLLDFGLSSNLAYITSVLTKATSVLTRLVRRINASLLKKPE